MGGIGALNPLPFSIGGGESDTEQVYRELRKVVGEGGAGPERDANPTSGDSIEDLWRLCKAGAIAAALRAQERAALQALPLYATDHLPVYEDALGVAEAPTETERQIAVTQVWVLQLSAAVPAIRADLQRIDPGFDLEFKPYDQVTTSQFGKQFGPMPGAAGANYGSGATAGVKSSAYPNFSDDFIVYVRFTLAPGATTIPPVTLARVVAYLNEVLPSFVDFSISTGHPFYLDGGPDGTSRMDQTAFG